MCRHAQRRQRTQRAQSVQSAHSRTDLAWLAQACAVARCAGTLVNLRKPLCNLGSVLASEIHGARVVLQSCWILVADSVGAVVEVRARARARSCTDAHARALSN
jgi:hypothetical protein